MSRLFMLLLSLSMGTLAGIGVIIVLVLGYVSAGAILGAALVGAVLAVPVTWLIARRMTQGDDYDVG